jgi:hypothetical protein
MTEQEVWNNDNPIKDRSDLEGLHAIMQNHSHEWASRLGVVPEWIDQGITPCDVAAIVQSGCNSGAYMPAVTHYQAREVMNKHGYEVMTFLEDNTGEIPIPTEVQGWDHLAIFYLSYAVETWASLVHESLTQTHEH